MEMTNGCECHDCTISSDTSYILTAYMYWFSITLFSWCICLSILFMVVVFCILCLKIVTHFWYLYICMYTCGISEPTIFLCNGDSNMMLAIIWAKHMFSGHQSLSLKSNAKQLLQPAVTSPLILHIVSMICVFTMWPASAKYKMYKFIPLFQAEVIWKFSKTKTEKNSALIIISVVY